MLFLQCSCPNQYVKCWLVANAKLWCWSIWILLFPVVPTSQPYPSVYITFLQLFSTMFHTNLLWFFELAFTLNPNIASPTWAFQNRFHWRHSFILRFVGPFKHICLVHLLALRWEQTDSVWVVHQQSTRCSGIVGRASWLPEEAGRILLTVEPRQPVWVAPSFQHCMFV